jgi:tRNA dimethylallyltransferase
MQTNLIVILGPTASGKTALAVQVARALGSEIISADSRQVYRGMNLGTGKDLSEYCIDGVRIPYHLIDIVDPDDDFSVFDYQQRFFRCFAEISSRDRLPVLVGGTGLYLESVLQGYRMCEVPENEALRHELAGRDMESLAMHYLSIRPGVHNKTDLLDRTRLIRAIEIAEYSRGAQSLPSLPEIRAKVVGVRWERCLLRERISGRLRQRLADGMIDEVRALHASGISWERLHYFGLEYRYIGLYLQGVLDYEAMLRTLNIKIHQFAKRQETWFRRMERKGTVIRWLDGADGDARHKLTDLATGKAK